ncbi:ATP synthase F1 subunit delta [Candidatus Berkelbacteria bacterium]|nr:ATP synthase F1 subunit delta [Candidatus Berkelbacteria bacterium]
MKITSRGLAQALYHAVVSEPKRVRAICENFLAYLHRQGRRNSLPAVLTHLEAIDEATHHRQTALVTTALPVSQSAKRAIAQLIQKRTGRQKVNAKYITDPRVIGGGTIRFHDTVIDMTVASRLKTILELS